MFFKSFITLNGYINTNASKEYLSLISHTEDVTLLHSICNDSRSGKSVAVDIIGTTSFALFRTHANLHPG